MELYFFPLVGCYEESSSTSSDVNEVVTWPYARIGDVVIPDNACSSRRKFLFSVLSLSICHWHCYAFKKKFN